MFKEESSALSKIVDLLFSEGNIITTISILVSATVAMIVLGVNQFYSNRRERKKLICQKIEEFYEASIVYTNACDKLVTDIQRMTYRCESGYYRNDPAAYALFEQSISKMEMLHGLYFQRIDFNSEDYAITKMPLIWAANSGELARKSVNSDDVYKASRAHINMSAEHLSELCKELMRKHMI